MTEEDTLKALKRWSYEDALQFWSKQRGPLKNNTSLPEVTGWTFDELRIEYRRRQELRRQV